MCSLQFVSPYTSIWYSCCPKSLIIHPTKPLIFCPCNHFLADLAQGFFAALAKWGSIMRLRIHDSNRRKGQMWDEADPRRGAWESPVCCCCSYWGEAGLGMLRGWAMCPWFFWGQQKQKLFRAFPAGPWPCPCLKSLPILCSQWGSFQSRDTAKDTLSWGIS